MSIFDSDIEENILLEDYPEVLDLLLLDRTTKKNIIWATNDYQKHGEEYYFHSEIRPELITGANGNLIMPRVKKNINLQQSRIREKAEVFTPSWICNAQNNLIDNTWFGYTNVFNIEKETDNGQNKWITNEEPIKFPKGKTWKMYIKDIRMEITCGEAPYLTSRYDTTTGEFINVPNRIGLLDRKLRVISENTGDMKEWLENAQIAYKSIYGFEWQGDNLLLAREALLISFIENFYIKFKEIPPEKSIKTIAHIISWNIWQMDGLKGVIPNSCNTKPDRQLKIFEETINSKTICEGCTTNNMRKHNGKFCKIKDWLKKDPQTKRMGKEIFFIETFN